MMIAAGFYFVMIVHFLLQDTGGGCKVTSSLASSENIIVLIQDGPDQAPYFTQGTYIGHVSEDADVVSF